jgi:hypothetical protein
MARARPYRDLEGDKLIKQLFDAAFEVDAAKYEDARFEIEGGEDGWYGRRKLARYKEVLLEAAQRVFDRDA